VIGPQVRLGDGCRLHAHVVIDGDTVLGEGCELWPFASVGARPQDRKLLAGAPAGKLRIGAHNQLREHVTISPGTAADRGVTAIGDHNMLLIGAHVGHDAQLGSHIVMTNGSMVAGHVSLGDRAVLGAMVGIHQFCRVGTLAMAGAGSMVPKDAPPYALVHGDRARIRGVNVVGMRRAGYTDEDVAVVKRAYRILFWRGAVMAARIQHAAKLWGDHPLVHNVLDFMECTTRGVLMARGRPTLEDPLDATFEQPLDDREYSG
jgi:UDP-N-acetylglucosamine acyltransferase